MKVTNAKCRECGSDLITEEPAADGQCIRCWQEENNYRDAVSDEMEKRYGITWVEAGDDTELLNRMRKQGIFPKEFVTWFAKKCDLTPVEEQ